jgi:hypothetical protein
MLNTLTVPIEPPQQSPSQAAGVQSPIAMPISLKRSDEIGAHSLAVPRRGHVISTAAEKYGSEIRDAVDILIRSLARQGEGAACQKLFAAPRAERPGTVSRSPAELAAWSIVSVWVVAIAVKAISETGSLTEAHRWFFSQERPTILNHVTASALARAEKILGSCVDSAAYLELLPYILDPHGPGSRLSVRRDPDTKKARAKKRAQGVFYTPADVADYMATNCLANSNGIPPNVLDPACGTGVFLRAALKSLRLLFPNKGTADLAAGHLYGVDIDPWPLDAAAFVLIADSLVQEAHAEPIVLWRRLRANLACVDALQLDPEDGESRSSESVVQLARVPLRSIFPSLTGGLDAILGNPPYADFADRQDLSALAQKLAVVAARPLPTGEIYLAFVEQMIRLAGKKCWGALVLPLSIACNVGAQFIATRQLIARTPGTWKFAFFDREPHALFGEDVKTRNTILLWAREVNEEASVVETGPLRKWRGDDRAKMFKAISFERINTDIRGGIPKIEGQAQAIAYTTLTGNWQRLEQAVLDFDKITLNQVLDSDNRTVFVGPTAYNFLNVFLRPPVKSLPIKQALSEHPLHAIRCATAADALAVFAVLTSHLGFWWWHVNGDGFHVSRKTLGSFPFGLNALQGLTGAELARNGRLLWDDIRGKPIVSLNGGRTSLAFTPNGHDKLRRMSDEVLAKLAGLSVAFVDDIQRFTARSVTATLHGSNSKSCEEV